MGAVNVLQLYNDSSCFDIDAVFYRNTLDIVSTGEVQTHCQLLFALTFPFFENELMLQSLAHCLLLLSWFSKGLLFQVTGLDRVKSRALI